VQSLSGRDIFMGQKAGCINCHSGVNFTNYAFENNGLYVQYKDEGRKRLTGLESDEAKFKIPTLRNIGYTAPYMHDGSIKDLESVIRHYESGGKAHKNKSVLIRPFNLTEQERNDLIQFLKSLSDEQFIKNPIFKF
jgi:cytochrome c peroxidase